MKADLSVASPVCAPGMLLQGASARKLVALYSVRLLRTSMTCLLLSGSGRQLRPSEPPGDADVDADAEDEDSVSFLELSFSGMEVWQLPCW